jgi:hypothetical protein
MPSGIRFLQLYTNRTGLQVKLQTCSVFYNQRSDLFYSFTSVVTGGTSFVHGVISSLRGVG